MDVATFCAQSHVLVVAGKGGVGKTTMTRGPGPDGRRSGHVGADRRARGQVGHHGRLRRPGTSATRRSCSHRRGRRRGRAGGSVRARRLTPDDALVEYLEDHGLQRVSKRLARSGVLDVVSTAIPGIRDVLVLGKVKQLERDGVADLIVVDAPATGHAITFLTSASGLVDAARGGPLRTQAQDVVELLQRPGPLPGDPGHPARGAAGHRDDRVGLHARGPGGRPARAGHRERLRPRAGRAGAAGRRGGGRRPGVDRRRRRTWRRSRRPGGSGWPATQSRPSRSSGCAASCPCPTCSCRRSTPTPSGRPRPRCWPTRWREAVAALVPEGAA